MQPSTDLLHTSVLREKLQRGEPCLGYWLGVADPLVVEALAADCPADWVQVDLEHSGLDWNALQMILIGWKGSSVPLFVRVPSHDVGFIARVLDLGASGIVVPFVNTPEEAARVAAACRYPPRGTRGFGPRRVSRHYTQTESYASAANEAVFLMVQIEDVRGAEKAQAIAEVEGVDALFIGPADLSFSLGIPMQWEHPDLLAAIRRVIAVGKEAGVPVAMAVDDSPAAIVRWFGEGLSMATIGVDWALMRQAIKQTAAEVRGLLGTE